jgi:uncharacterized protein YjbJ (UPF0337 family)
MRGLKKTGRIYASNWRDSLDSNLTLSRASRFRAPRLSAAIGPIGDALGENANTEYLIIGRGGRKDNPSPGRWSFRGGTIDRYPGFYRGLTKRDRERAMVDKDRIEGAAKQAAGGVKKVAGKVLGDAKLESEGKAEQAAGKVQNAVGGVKDALRGK